MGKKIQLSIFFSIFFLFGLFVTIFVARDSYRSTAAHGWNSTNCQIIQSSINDKIPYKFSVQYTYEFDGHPFTGQTLSRGYTGSDDYYDARKLQEKYSPGSNATCFVDPANPGNSVLQLTSLWYGFAALFPLIFVLIGACGLYFTWRPMQRSSDGELSGRQLAFILPPFFGVFFSVGAGLFFWKFIPEYLRAQAAQKWPQVPCVVEHSGVASHTSSGSHGGTTYSVDVLFEYAVDGRTYKSSRYLLNPVSSSDYTSYQRLATSLRQSSKQICYINPQDPDDAVMDRSNQGLWLLGGASIFFGLVGAVGEVGLVYTFWQNRSARRELHTPHVTASGFMPVKPARGALTGTWTIWVFAIFWCSITLILDVASGMDFLQGTIEWFPIIFLTVFSIIGLAFLGFAGFKSLAVLDPVPHVVISSLPIRLGHPVEIRWQILSKSHWIDKLKVEVRGCRMKKSSVGIGNIQSSSQFWHHGPAQISNPAEIRTGFCRFTIPPNIWPTEIADDTIAACVFLMEGNIPNWPAMRKEFWLPVENHSEMARG